MNNRAVEVVKRIPGSPETLTMALIVLTAPLEKIHWKVGFTLRPIMVLSFLAFYLWTIRSCIYGYKPSKEVKTLIILFFLLVLTFMLASINSIDPVISARHIILYLTLFLLSFIVIESVKQITQIEKLIKLWMSVGILMCCYGVTQFVGMAYGFDIDKVFFGLLYSQPEPLTAVSLRSPLGRSYSLFGDANNYAGYLNTVFPFFLCSALFYSGRRMLKKQYLFIFLMWFVLLAFVLTLSRSGGIGIAALLLSAAILKRKQLFYQNNKLFWLVNFSLLGFMFWQLGGSILPMITARLTETHSSGIHFYVAESALKLFAMNPLTGVGLGNFGAAYGLYFNPGFEYYNAHSAFLTILSETGLVGIVVYMSLYGFILREVLAFRNRVEGYTRDVVADGMLLGFIGLLSANIFYQNFTYQFFWVFMSLGIAAAIAARKRPMHARYRDVG